MHRVISKLSSINLVIKNYAENTIDDLISKVPSAYKERVFKIIKILDEYTSSTQKLINEWFNKVKDLAGNCGYAREVKEYKENPDNWPGHVGDVSTAIRVIVTGRRNTPNLCEIMKVLGKDTVIRRLENAIKNI